MRRSIVEVLDQKRENIGIGAKIDGVLGALG